MTGPLYFDAMGWGGGNNFKLLPILGNGCSVNVIKLIGVRAIFVTKLLFSRSFKNKMQCYKQQTG